MQANELRIGNWVKFITHDDDVFTEQITGKDIELMEYIAKYPNDPEERIRFQLRWDPIPLTPEILEGCGFEFDSDRNSFVYKVKNDYVEYYEAVSGNQLSLCCDEHNFYLPLDHITGLHQLQNFIYFTFNTELQWNRKQ